MAMIDHEITLHCPTCDAPVQSMISIGHRETKDGEITDVVGRNLPEECPNGHDLYAQQDGLAAQVLELVRRLEGDDGPLEGQAVKVDPRTGEMEPWPEGDGLPPGTLLH